MSGVRVRVRMGQRLLVLVLLGVLTTLTVVGTALVSLSQVSAVNRELTQVSHALQHHKTADEMHDALRADVARAQLVAAGGPGPSAATIRADTRRHAARFRAALDDTARLRLSGRLMNAFTRLHPIQDVYITTAEAMVASALSRRGASPGALADYEAAFLFLVPEQNRLTERLVATTARVEARAAAERATAERAIGIAAGAALAGWLGMAAWHHRSLRRLQRALVSEAEQRSTADTLQRSLLPPQLPVVPGAQLAAGSVLGSAAQRVGGDWYDAFTLPSGHVCLVVGDVVGHDLPAAAVMGQLRNCLRAYALIDPSPTRVLTRLNRAAYLFDTCDLATCIYVVCNPTARTAVWASAGHPAPVVMPAKGARHLLEGEPGPPLGATTTADYPEHHLRLTKGDGLLLYSDGLVERHGASIDAGLTALRTIPLPAADPDTLCQHLLRAMLDNTTTYDDTTCLLLQTHDTASDTADLGVSREAVG
jgi:serine phosphatase RsbU (regulator of sigma subunit)